jgi:hypothetical protein
MARIDIREIKLLLDTNIPGKEIVPFTKSILYQPNLKDTSSWNNLPYFTFDYKYPEGYLSTLTYEKQMEFFFNKSTMDKIIRLQSDLSRGSSLQVDIKSESEQKRENENKTQEKVEQETAEQEQYRKKKNFYDKVQKDTEEEIEKKIHEFELSQINQNFDPSIKLDDKGKFVDAKSSTEESVEHETFDAYIDLLKKLLKRNDETIFKTFDEIKKLTKRPEFEPFYKKGSRDFDNFVATLTTKNWLGQGKPLIDSSKIFDENGSYSKEFCKLIKDNNGGDSQIFQDETASSIESLKTYITSLTQKLRQQNLYNNAFYNKFHPTEDDKYIARYIDQYKKDETTIGSQIISIINKLEGLIPSEEGLENRVIKCNILLQIITDNYEETIKNIKSNLDEKMKFIEEIIKKVEKQRQQIKKEETSKATALTDEFIKKQFEVPEESTESKSIESKSAPLSTKKPEDSRNKIIDKNVMIMLRLMFPTKYPIIGNVLSSFNSVVTDKNEMRLKWTDFIPGFLKRKIFEGMMDYSYLKIDGNIYTVSQVIWENDIYNHKEYKKLVDQFEELQRWKSSQLIKIKGDTDKKRKRFKQNYETQINREDIKNIEKTKIANRSDERPLTPIEERYNRTINSLLIIMKDVIINMKENNYNKIIDNANKFVELYLSIRNSYEYRTWFNPPNQRKYDDLVKKMREEVFNIQADDYILENYLKQPGINLDYKNDTKYRRILEQRYQVYVKFIDNIRNFRAPVLESSNYLLQNSIDDFLNNTEKYKGIFNFLINPTNIKRNPFSVILPTSLPDDKEDIMFESNQYNYRMNTGISIRSNKGSTFYEIYVQVNLIGGELNDNNKSKIDCLYQGETLGDKLSRILNEAIYNPWNINSTRVFFDITDKKATKDPNKELPEEKEADRYDSQLINSSLAGYEDDSYEENRGYRDYGRRGYDDNYYQGGRKNTKKYRQQFVKRFTRKYN